VGAEVAGPLAAPAALLEQAAAAPGEPAALIADASARRLEVAAGRKRIEAAKNAVKEADVRWWPSVDLTGTVRATNEAGFSGREVDWWVGVSLTWLIWDGGEAAAESAQRETVVEIARLEVSGAERRIAQEVRHALSALAAAQASIRQAEAAVELARRNVGETAALYREGLARALEVSDANVRLFEAEVTLVRERYGLAMAFLDLRAALGLDPLGREAR
jgi:outer membrane protein TolC